MQQSQTLQKVDSISNDNELMDFKLDEYQYNTLQGLSKHEALYNDAKNRSYR